MVGPEEYFRHLVAQGVPSSPNVSNPEADRISALRTVLIACNRRDPQLSSGGFDWRRRRIVGPKRPPGGAGQCGAGCLHYALLTNPARAGGEPSRQTPTAMIRPEKKKKAGSTMRSGQKCEPYWNGIVLYTARMRRGVISGWVGYRRRMCRSFHAERTWNEIMKSLSAGQGFK